MSLIVVIEQDGSRAKEVSAALAAEGWSVETCTDLDVAVRVVAGKSPQLVVAGERSVTTQVVQQFSRSQGGPGLLVIGGEIAGADGSVAGDATDEQVRLAVRRCLSTLSRKAVQQAAKDAALSGNQLTSADIFGDLLDEVEGGGAVVDSAKSRPPHKKTVRPVSAKPKQTDIDRKLEQTLSGVLDTPKRKRAPSRQPSGEIDDLINKTLSGVVPSSLQGKPRRKAKAPTLETVPEPIVEEQRAPRKARPSADSQVNALVGSMGRSPKPQSATPTPPTPAAPPKAPDVAADAKPSKPPVSRVDVQPSPEPVEQPKKPDVYGTMRMPVVKPPVEPVVAEVVPEPIQSTIVSKPGRKSGASKAKVAKAKDGEEKRQFGQYTLMERVAVGGMAEVWKARMQGVEGFQKNVAIKRILPHLTDSSDFLTMFIDEAKLAAQLNHPNIVHIYDLGKIENDYYIAMEYIAGKDLRSILNEGRRLGKPLPLGMAVLITSRLASGLEHAHRKRDFDNRDLGLVHRDVSPQNVLVSFDGDVKLCDFGIAKAVAKASKTQMGALKGKLQYMSPEQAWGRVVDARSDIFSLGSVFFEMLTGERLFAGESEISVLESVREGRVRSVREIAGQVSVEIESVVAKALAKDPDERYQTAGEMQQELEAILFSIKPTPVEASLHEYMKTVYGTAAETPSGESEVAQTAKGATPPLEEAKEKPVVDAVAPKPGSETEDSAGRPVGLWLGLAAAVLIVVGVVWFAVGNQPAETPPAPGTEAAEVVPEAPVADQGAPELTPGSTEAALDPAAEIPTDGSSEVESPTEATEEAVGGGTESASTEDSSLAALVAEQVQAREAEQEQARLELARQVQAAQLAAEAAEQEAANQSAALEANAPDDPAASVNQELAVAENDETEAAVAEISPEQVEEAPEQIPDPVAVAEPPPAQVEPEPEPEPVRPSFTEGQLVEQGTVGLIAPRLVGIDTPQYPPMARRMRVQGTVVVAALVDEKGQVVETRLVKQVRQKVGLNTAAVKAVEGARFQPATIQGVRVKTWFTLSVPFKL